MSQTYIDTTDNLTRKRWARGLFTVVQKAFEFPALIGTDENAVIQQKQDLSKGEGDEVKFGILLNLKEPGTIGRDSIEGKAERMQFRDMKLGVEKMRKAVDIGQDIDHQRVPYDLMASGKNGLQQWWQDFIGDYAFHQLCGNSQMASELYQLGGLPFGAAPTEPDVEHLMAVGQPMGSIVEANVAPSDELTLGFLDGVKQLAELPRAGSNAFRLRPIRVGNKTYYRVILHKFAFDSLRRNTNVGEWGDMLRNAKELNIPHTDVEYNGMLITKSERIYSRNFASGSTKSRVYRNLFLGAQSAVWAWGGAGSTKSTSMSFVVRDYDHGSRTEVSGGGILGMAKTRFKKGSDGEDHGDYGAITFLSAAAPLAPQ